MNQFSDKGVCRTAPATLGLCKTTQYLKHEMKSQLLSEEVNYLKFIPGGCKLRLQRMRLIEAEHLVRLD